MSQVCKRLDTEKANCSLEYFVPRSSLPRLLTVYDSSKLLSPPVAFFLSVERFSVSLFHLLTVLPVTVKR